MDIFHHITEIPNPPPQKKCLYSAASCIASPWGSRGKNGACHFIFQSPWWSLVKLLMGNPTVSKLTSLLICWKWTKPRLRRSGAPAGETWGVPSLWCGATQEEAPCAKFITVKMQLCLTAAAAADLLLSGACVNSEFITFLVKAKHLNCVQPVWPFIVSIYNKKESRLKT